MDSDLANSRVWDEVYYTDKERLARVASGEEAAPWFRQVHARFHFGDSPSWEALELELRMRAGPMVSGLHLLVLAALREYRQIVELGFSPAPRSDLELQLEEAVYGRYALSVAYAQLGRYREGELHLEAAIFAAEVLTLRGRAEMLERERQRQHLANGAVERSRTPHRPQLVPGSREDRWAREIYVGDLLASGRYQFAYEEARALELPGDFTNVVAAAARIPLTDTEEPTAANVLALTIRDLWEGKLPPRAPSSEQRVWDLYATVGEAVTLTRSGKAFQASRRLPQGGPDNVRAFTLGLRWAHWLSDGVESDVPALALPSLLHDALDALADPSDVAAWLVRLLAHELTVLKLAGWAHPAVEAALADTATLQHKNVWVGGRAYRTNERATEALLVDGYNGDYLQMQALRLHHPMFEWRYRHKLELLALSELEVVNPGVVLRLTERFDAFVREGGRWLDKKASSGALGAAREMAPALIRELADES